MNTDELLFPEIDFAMNELANLHALLKKARPHGPIVQVRYHSEPAFLVLSHEAVADGLSDDEVFPTAAFHEKWSRPTLGRTLLCMTGVEHRRTRGLVNTAFRPAVMRRSVETLLEPVAHQLIDDFAGERSVELVEGFAHRYPATIIMRMLGLPLHDESQILRWALDLIHYPWEPEEALRASREFTAYLAKIVRARREDPEDDLLSELCTVEVEGERLSDEEVFSLVRLLFPAGADTTFKALGSLYCTMLSLTDLADELADDPALRASVVEETLRFEPPISLQPRMSRAERVTWFGTDIPGDSPMLFAIAAANRDPEVFSDPDRFDPTRKARHLLTFGWGPHFCLGSHLARREMDVATRTLSERCPNMRLADRDGVEVVGGVLRGPRKLQVEFDPA
ncbi:MAG: cytochrome P450 [Deltaproteobacteria bacterium]|nr:cytochrome P450 [Deltaproteobacteria bacterium]